MNYEWEDILIVGDSFCADRELPTHWPQVLTTKLSNSPYKKDRIPRGRGFPGASWWAAKKELDRQFSIRIPKVVIVCHTEPFRIPHDTNWGINTLSVQTGNIYIPADSLITPTSAFKRAAVSYYEHIISEEFHLWAFNKWLHEIDTLLHSHSEVEKVVHFFCFEGPYNNFDFKKGISFTVPLIEYQKVAIGASVAVAPNHFTIADNLNFGLNLYETLKNYPGDAVQLNTKLIGK